jgi:hypothetical protein
MKRVAARPVRRQVLGAAQLDDAPAADRTSSRAPPAPRAQTAVFNEKVVEANETLGALLETLESL